MADDMKNTDPNTPQQPDAAPQPPVTPEPPTEPMPQQQPPMGQQVPPAQPQPQPQQPMYGAPQPQPQAFYPPAPLMQLTGGMKFAWLVVGALMGIPGIIISWLVNVDKMPQVKSDALKFTVIGFVINIVFWFIMSFLITGAISAAVYGMMGSLDSGSYGYGYHGSW
ncbi:spore coat protein SP96 [Eggerthella guodeyinii]|uniref:Spore coat protein SP96 n=1 Tax=Eggerthella guodeyinii TaxID=2690837 RepID=A0A6N7RRY6_9ACTN|nr:spore coat protein SP96 [Eggerthella guodeyinii]MRX83964.1 spore coat protein SP96 [Eggerthella guodeyinii]